MANLSEMPKTQNVVGLHTHTQRPTSALWSFFQIVEGILEPKKKLAFGQNGSDNAHTQKLTSGQHFRLGKGFLNHKTLFGQNWSDYLYFLGSFFPFHLFKKGSCELLAK